MKKKNRVRDRDGRSATPIFREGGVMLMPGKNKIKWSCMVYVPMKVINGSLWLRMDNLKFKMQTQLTKNHINN